MQRKFFSIAMIGLLIFSALNLNIFLTQEIESQNNSELLDNKENNIGTRAIEGGGPSRTLPESTSHGGSWLDSFEDDTGITWSLSNNFRLIGGDVKMMEESPPFNVDPYTVALWHFDEGSGTIAYDETLNNNDGTLGGDGIGPDLPTWTTGKFGGGLDFDGINDHILVPDKNEFSIDTTGEFTVDFWVKTGNDITSRQEMICKGGQSTSDPYEWCIRIMNGNFVATFCNPSGANIRNENVPVSMNTWYYFMVVYNGYTKDDDIEIYCNGVESSLIANQASYTYSNTNGELGMGRLYTTSGGWNHFSGILDEIRISNITRRPFYNKSTLISKPINIPPGMAWDSIILNKTLPNNTYLNVTILNATNNQPIPGAPKYINNGEFDISYINPTQNPSIRMKAGFKGNSTVSPVFHYWGVSWNASNAWKDSFFGGVKVEGSNNVGILDGNAKLLMNKYDMEDNLAGLWHFDEGSGTIAYDETSNNNDGTLGGDGIGSDLPTWTTGKFGNALDFDGVNDYVNCGNDVSLNVASQFSIEAWIKADSISGARCVVQRGRDTPSHYGIWTFDDDLIFGSWNHNVYSGKINVGIWYHVVATYDGTFKRMYKNGVLSGGPSSRSIAETNGDLTIGQALSLSEYFDGIIDEVAIYNRALTNDEIKYNYQNGLIINQKEGDLTSEQITIPPVMYWNTLIINKTEPPKTYLNITILDAVTNQSIESYDNLTGANIDISSINTHIHNSIKLQAKFESNGTVTPILHDWSLNWTPNKPPIVLTFQSASNTVFRTNTTQLTINISDYEDTVNNLTVDIKYRSPVDLIWQDLFLTEQNSYEKHLNVNFTPDKNADLGDYSFNVSCNDSFQEFNYKIFNNVITVLNNPPTAPDVIITPTIPKTLDDLTATAYNVTDLEDEPIVHYYEWYKDDELQLELNTDLVPSEYTTQNEVWKCIVTPSDGNENGTTGEAEVIVQNTAPEINQSLLSVTFYEDTKDYSLDLSYTFKDLDYDELSYRYSGNDKLYVNIFDSGIVELIPEPDWFGTEALTFFANDSVSEVNDSVVVKVLPTNDAPVFIEIIGPKNIYLPSQLIEIPANEDEWLNLAIIADDIDGDTLAYFTNRTDNNDLDDLNNFFITDNLISFLPTNDDVGELFVNITISDNNGSEIYQNIKIRIRNTNDPPTVKITYPNEGSEFMTTESINFSCEWSDLDFNVPEPTEHLTFTWYTNLSEDQIGRGEALTNKTLEAGYHQITIEVWDSGITMAEDSINITVTAPQPPQIKGKVQTETEEQWWAILIIIVFIIIMIIVGFLMFKRKKAAEEAAKAEAVSPGVLIPEIVGGPVGEPLPAAPTVPIPLQIAPSVSSVPIPTLAPTPTVAPTSAPVLAGVQPGVTPSLPPAQPEEKEELSKAEKLKLIEERLAKSEISQESYEELKKNLEIEEAQPSVSVEPPAPTILAQPVPVPAPQLKTPVVPTMIKPEIAKVEQPPGKESTPLQPEVQPPLLEKPVEESKVEPPAVICPQCQSSAITTYPDGSFACSLCNYKWI